MHFRCYQRSHKAFERYAGRNIGVCDEWRHDYSGFMSWALANGYDPALQIDRIDNDGNYEPSNCRWVTPRAQQNNRRNNRPPITMLGETKTVSDWARDDRCACGVGVFYTRISSGMAPERALLTVTAKAKEAVWIAAFGETKRPEEWLADPRCNVQLASLYWRIKNGWNHETAITKPPRGRVPRKSPLTH